MYFSLLIYTRRAERKAKHEEIRRKYGKGVSLAHHLTACQLPYLTACPWLVQVVCALTYYPLCIQLEFNQGRETQGSDVEYCTMHVGRPLWKILVSELLMYHQKWRAPPLVHYYVTVERKHAAHNYFLCFEPYLTCLGALFFLPHCTMDLGRP